jgi:acetyl-CoA synthetase
MSEQNIESALQENRLFPPSADFAAKAHVKSREEYDRMYRESIDDPEAFWGRAAEPLHWFKRWDRVLEWKSPYARWFVGGQTNMAYNCLDRQIELGRGDKTAILWEGEPLVTGEYETSRGEYCETGDANGGKCEVRRVTFKQLKDDVCRFANGLKKLGIKRGDRVTIYMPMVPEAAVAMLACARIGAPHSVIFGGFSSQAIADRVEDAKSNIIITADGGYRRGQIVALKANVDDALTKTSLVNKVIVLKHTDAPIEMKDGRDIWWSDVISGQSTDCPAEHMDAEDMLFVLYTSGSTGKPKGILHTTAGYMLGCYLTTKYTFDMKDADVFWCTADVGWITGHSYIIYGILPNRVPTLMYEGAPNFPDEARFWDMVERHKVTQFYTAPTAIRAFMKWGDEHPARHDLSSLQVLGTVGEPINPEAWMWYREKIGGNRCPIVDTWWQTETGGHMITPLPGATPTKPGSCTLPFFGVDAAIVDELGVEQPLGTGGLLAIRRPWPGMLRGIHGDRQRFVDTYFSKFEVEGNRPAECPSPYYFPGDGALHDKDGYFWILGRVDDVINVSGHRLGTMEIESALVSHPAVVEAAVVGMPHEIKGTGIAAFVTLGGGGSPSEELRESLRAHVAEEIGAIARPDQIRFAAALPKTRSGKIMRRLLRARELGQDVGDISTLEG